VTPLRVALGWAALVASTVLTGVAILLVWPFSPRGKAAFRIAAVWGRVAMRAAGVRVGIEGVERATGGPFVIVANHGSMLDIPILFASLPIQFRFVSRPFFFRIPFLGWGMTAGGHVSLDPRRPRQATRALAGLRRRFGHGISVLLFPEGTRSRDGAIARYKRGPFLTAIRNGVPLLPVALRGAHDALPPGRFVARPGPVTIVVGDPVPTEGRPEEDAEELARSVEAWARATVESPPRADRGAGKSAG